MDFKADQHEDAAPGPSLPLDLMLPYMSSKEWLACFQTNHVMADEVVRHASRTYLTLHLSRGTAIAAGGSSSSSSSSSNSSSSNSSSSSNRAEGGRPDLQVVQQLTAHAEAVALTLHGGLATPVEWLRGRITSIRLLHVQLPAADVVACTLQLHTLPRLHTLSLEGCTYQQGSSSKGGSYQPAASVRTLECTTSVTASPQRRPPASSCLPLALSLVDPAQLQTVTTDEVTVLDRMQHMTALQELNLPHVARDAARVQRAMQQGLLTHPGLQRLSLGEVYITANLSEQPCTLHSLQLLEGANTTQLLCLPLASLKSFTVRGDLGVGMMPNGLRAVIEHIKQCPHVAFEPSSQAPHASNWQPLEPAFTLSSVSSELAPEYAQLVSMCLQRMVGGGALTLFGIPFTPAVLASLAAVPPTITTISFQGCEAPAAPAAPAAAPAVAAPVQAPPLDVGVVASLPAHIQHVVLGFCNRPTAAEWIAALPHYIRGLDRPLRLTLLTDIGVMKAGTGGWQEGDKAEVRAWLREHASSQLQVDFQVAV